MTPPSLLDLNLRTCSSAPKAWGDIPVNAVAQHIWTSCCLLRLCLVSKYITPCVILSHPLHRAASIYLPTGTEDGWVPNREHIKKHSTMANPATEAQMCARLSELGVAEGDV